MPLLFSGFPLAQESEFAFSRTYIPGKALFSVLCWTPEHRCPICVSLVHQPLWGFRPLHQAIITWHRPIPSPAGLGAALLRPGLSLLSALSSQLDSSISRKYQIWLLFKLSQRYFCLIWRLLSKERLCFPSSGHETRRVKMSDRICWVLKLFCKQFWLIMFFPYCKLCCRHLPLSKPMTI